MEGTEVRDMWYEAEHTNYTPKTTYWQDFSGNEHSEIALRSTYNKCEQDAIARGYIALTELVLVLNHKMWRYYQTDMELSKAYYALYRKAILLAETTLSGEELQYYYREID
jgi:hypothetical protein